MMKNDRPERVIPMNKKLILIAGILVFAGCEEQSQYKQAVFEQMQADKDLQDYHVDLEQMTQCVVDMSSKNMPGFAAFDPIRKDAYKNYQKMLALKNTKDPKQTMDELRQAFGSPKGLADAHSNYTESVVECMSGLVTDKINKEQEQTPEATAK
jgi:hypothetical protein